MSVLKVEIANFRLLEKVTIPLNEQTTVIVGRNNSGKTSLTELFRRLSHQSPSFPIEDFSLSAHDQFWQSFVLHCERKEEPEILETLPIIEVKLTIGYDEEDPSLGPLEAFIIDVNEDCKEALVVVRYQPKKASLGEFFEGIDKFKRTDNEDEQKREFFRIIRNRVQRFYEFTVCAVDPNDHGSQKPVNKSQLDALFQAEFISAQRGLDDITHRDRDVLGKVLEVLFSTAMSDSANEVDSQVARRLEDAVKTAQDGINREFDEQLKNLLPAISLFGYPGLGDPEILTETTLDVERLLQNHTKVYNAGINGLNLPEGYNGLGARNLIFILLKLVEFYRSFMILQPQPNVHLIFIEEPEVHLHPQMQEVFISQLDKLAKNFENAHGREWPVKFIVTTHSSHLANRAPFDAIRYFRSTSDGREGNVCKTEVKDLGNGLGNNPKEDQAFLHKYMTLTRCDLLFADKAVLIEGTTERLMLPEMIKKVDEDIPDETKLSSQYISVVEVGGAYAHRFFGLLEFLGLRTLIITDLDTAKEKTVRKKKVRVACKVSEGTCTTNACISTWFKNDKTIKPADLLLKTDTDKIRGVLRLAYQVPEAGGTTEPCGRSFEESFMLSNPQLFDLAGLNDRDMENQAEEKAKNVRKSDFALKHAIDEVDWNVPRYIREGLLWLAEGISCTTGLPSPHIGNPDTVRDSPPQQEKFNEKSRAKSSRAGRRESAKKGRGVSR